MLPDPTDTKFCKKRAMRVDAFGRETTRLTHDIISGDDPNPLSFSNDILLGGDSLFLLHTHVSTEDIYNKYIE